MLELIIALAVVVVGSSILAARGMSLFGSILINIILADASVALMSRNGINFRQDTDKTKLRYQISAGLAAGLVHIVFSTIFLSLFCQVNIFSPLDLGIGTIIIYALSCCISAAAEELFFRNYVYYKINQSIKNKILCAILTSLVFVAAHFVAYSHLPVSFILLGLFICFILSLFLILLRDHINSYTVWSMISTHCIINLYTQMCVTVYVGPT